MKMKFLKPTRSKTVRLQIDSMELYLVKDSHFELDYKDGLVVDWPYDFKEIVKSGREELPSSIIAEMSYLFLESNIFKRYIEDPDNFKTFVEFVNKCLEIMQIEDRLEYNTIQELLENLNPKTFKGTIEEFMNLFGYGLYTVSSELPIDKMIDFIYERVPNSLKTEDKEETVINYLNTIM